MSMEYIRRHYGVPAKRGGRVEFTESNGARFKGTILSTRAALLRVKLDGLRVPVNLHPTWNIKYLPDVSPT